MRTYKTIELSIPTPCSQNWEEMSVNDTGRFCDNCNKTVIDFTHYSDQQLADFFKRSKGNVCGKLRNDQLEKPLYPGQYSQNRPFPQLLISAALTIGLGNNVYSTEKHIDPPTVHIVTSTKTEENRNNSTTGSDSTRVISGTVIDKVTKDALPGVTILIEGTVVGTSTNMDGFFLLDISSHLHVDSIQLIISSIGYTTKTLKYAPKDFPSTITIELDEGMRILSVGMLVTKKATFGQRIKYWFKRKFNN